MDQDEAVAALMAMNEAPAQEAPPAALEQAPAPATTPQAEDYFTSATNWDEIPSQYRPAVEKKFHEFQSDYTRKTQDLAAQRKAFEDIGGVEEARLAVETINRMNTDAEFARQTYMQLQAALTEAGVLEAQQSAVTTPARVDPEYGDADEGVIPPQFEQKIRELESWQQRIENEREETHLINEMQRSETAIRQANPHYTDDDFAAIYQLSYATKGDLVSAQKQYQGMQDRILSGYAQTKANVPTGITPGGSTAHASPPTNMSLDEAHRAAEEAFKHVFN